MKRVSQRLAQLCIAIGSVTLIVMTGMVVVDIFMRTFLSRSLGFVDEVTGYLVVVITLLGVGITFREGAMFRVSFLYQRLFPIPAKRILGKVYLAIAAIFCMTMMWYTALLVWSSYVREKVAPTELQTPIFIPQLVLPIGFLVLLIFVLEKFFSGEIDTAEEKVADETSGE